MTQALNIQRSRALRVVALCAALAAPTTGLAADEIDWGFRNAFRAYVYGGTGAPPITTSAGATCDPNPDPMRGGYTDLRKISVLADTWGLQMAPHLFPEINVQLLASIPNGAWIEDMGLSEDLWVEPVKVTNGTITAPERAGHGLAFKPEIMKDCRVN